MTDVISILRQKGLRLTDGRLQILELLHHEAGALSHREINGKLNKNHDPVTTYRTLVSFRKRGLVHAVLDPGSGGIKYCLNKPGLPENHAHFKCKVCESLTCMALDVERVASISIPAGYESSNYMFVVEGLCAKCKEVARTKESDIPPTNCQA